MSNLKGSVLIALFTFLLAVLVTLSSQTHIKDVSLFLAIIILLTIIFIGIISDMVGVAATAAEERTFNAKASKKILGARQGLFLVKHADRVSSLMCDIVGDICGTISGAIGLAIVFRVVQYWNSPETFVNLITIGLVAALTVGGKAFFKTFGIKKANDIIFFAGKILAGFEAVWVVIVSKIRGVK